MSWKDRAKPVKPSWRDRARPTEPASSAPEVSQAESAVRGAFKGASAGFVDELAGGLEALGSKVGVRGLGGGFDEIRRETPNESGQSFQEVYESRRDQRRALDERAEVANPKTFMAGDVAGSLVLPGPGKGSLLAKTGKMAGIGAVEGLGRSNAEGQELASDVAKSAAFAGAMPGVMAGAGKAVKAVGGGIRRATTGLGPEVGEHYLANKAGVNAARELPSVTEDFLNKAREQGQKLSEDSGAAYDILKQSGKTTTAGDLAAQLQTHADNLDELGAYTPEARKTIGYLRRTASNILDSVGGDGSSEIGYDKVKSLVKQLDRAIEQAKKRGGVDYQELVAARKQLDGMLKEAVPEYGTHMGVLADETRALTGLTDQFSKDKGAEQMLRRVMQGKDRYTEKALQNFDRTAGTGFTKELKDAAVKQALGAGTTNGSRNTLMGALAGSSASTVASGAPSPVIVALGAALGYAGDKLTRPVYKAMLDATSSPAFQKFATPFQKAAERGPAAVSVLHHTLLKNDPEYAALWQNQDLPQ